MDELLKSVPKEFHGTFRKLVAVTDAFCESHLNDEYKDVCRELAVEMCQEGTPIAKGKLESWAAGIVWAAGWVNFLTDPSQTPHMTGEEVAKGMGVSVATMQAKSRDIRAGLRLQQFDPDFTLPSLQDDNPLIWMVELKNGLIVDLRREPREVQVEAFRRGIIPYVPADRQEGRKANGDGGLTAAVECKRGKQKPKSGEGEAESLE